MEEGFILAYGPKGTQSSWEGMVAGECHTEWPVWKERENRSGSWWKNVKAHLHDTLSFMTFYILIIL